MPETLIVIGAGHAAAQLVDVVALGLLSVAPG